MLCLLCELFYFLYFALSFVLVPCEFFPILVYLFFLFIFLHGNFFPTWTIPPKTVRVEYSWLPSGSSHNTLLEETLFLLPHFFSWADVSTEVMQKGSSWALSPPTSVNPALVTLGTLTVLVPAFSEINLLEVTVCVVPPLWTNPLLMASPLYNVCLPVMWLEIMGFRAWCLRKNS